MLVYNKEQLSARVWTQAVDWCLSATQSLQFSELETEGWVQRTNGCAVWTLQHYVPCHPCLCSSCTYSILTPVHAQRSSIRAPTYTTQVRSSGSQVFVGYGNHRAEPDTVLRRGPTATDEQRQQRVGSRALSPSELWPQSAKERPWESSGYDLRRSIQLSPGKPDTVLHTVKPLKNQQTLLWIHVVPIRMSPWMTDDNPLTKIDNAAALSTNEATENTGTG